MPGPQARPKVHLISGLKFHFHKDGIFSVWALNEQDIYQRHADIFCICRCDAPCTQIRWQSRYLCALLPAQLGNAIDENGTFDTLFLSAVSIHAKKIQEPKMCIPWDVSPRMSKLLVCKD